jgi:quercetin dioxygenase-like cupin family protein
VKLYNPSELSVESCDPVHFTGLAKLTRMMGVNADPTINIYRVRFEPRSRTAWHTHSGIQLLVIIEGTCCIQASGEKTFSVPTGGIIQIDRNEKHWHGADKNASMMHIAINIDATTEWLEKVSDAEYDN